MSAAPSTDLTNQTPAYHKALITPALLPYLVLAGLFVFLFFRVLAVCAGKFVYSLDDPYIHLALAERIASGTYGINPGEPASPSSSALWPFLLAPFSRLSGYEYLPLVINIVFAAVSLYIYTQFIKTALADGLLSLLHPNSLGNISLHLWSGILGILLIPATNLMGLAFTGMEHVMQGCLCAAVVFGTAQVLSGRRAPAWLVAAMVLAALVRYESLAVILPAVFILLLRREWKIAISGLAGALIGLGLFSLFLLFQGLPWLPASVLDKAGATGPLADLPRQAMDHLNWNLRSPQALKMVVGSLGLAILALTKKGTRFLVLPILTAAALQLVFGSFGWWDRYEVYMVAAGWLAWVWVGRHQLAWLVMRLQSRSSGAVIQAVLLVALVLWISQPYIRNYLNTPLASANIYQQQYQMHRFVVDFLKAPVAVNDLGWVSFGNPYPVLDLWGLASYEALQLRKQSQAGLIQSADWMDRLTRAKGVETVMIYDSWFGRTPSNWIRIARLNLGVERVVSADKTVTFYATTPQQVKHLSRLLSEFEPTLPQDVRLELLR